MNHTVTVNVNRPDGNAAALLPPDTLIATVVIGDGSRSYRKPIVFAFEPVADGTEDYGLRQLNPAPAADEYGVPVAAMPAIALSAKAAVFVAAEVSRQKRDRGGRTTLPGYRHESDGVNEERDIARYGNFGHPGEGAR